MTYTFRVALCLLSLSLFSPAPAQSQAVPVSSSASGVSELAVALARAGSDEEQERLLARGRETAGAELLAALRGLTYPLVQKGEYAEAARISRLAVRVAEKDGDRLRLGNADRKSTRL